MLDSFFVCFQKQSKYKPGVTWHKFAKKWTAFFTINGKSVYLGSSDNEIDCAKIINQKCVELGLEKRFPELGCLKPSEKNKSAKVTIIFCKCCIPFFFRNSRSITESLGINLIKNGELG